MEKHEAMVRFQ